MSDISRVQASDSDTRARPALTNLRVTGQAVEDANAIASALGMRQRQVVANLLALVREVMEGAKARGATPEQMREAVFGKRTIK